jgi:hypothetical protein
MVLDVDASLRRRIIIQLQRILVITVAAVTIIMASRGRTKFVGAVDFIS